MHIKHRIPLLVSHVLYDRVPGIARTIHNDVQAAKGINSRLDQMGGKCRIGDITWDCNSFATRFPNSSNSLLSRSWVDIADDNNGPFGPQLLR